MKKCSIEGCEGEFKGLGFCQKHLTAFRKYGDPRYHELHNKLILYQGKTQSLRAWSMQLGIPYTTALHRLKVGEPLERIFTVGKLFDGESSPYKTIHTKDANGNIKNRQLHRILGEEGYQKEHGKKLPKGAVVHHKDGNPENNDPSNLVVCLSNKEHFLLHRKLDAFNACGHEDWRKCSICKIYSPVKDVYISPDGRIVHHKECQKKRSRENYLCKKMEQSQQP